MRDVDEGPRTVTVGGGRRRWVVLGAGLLALALVGLSWSGGSDPEPAAAPTTTTTLPAADAVPGLEGQRLLVHSGEDYVVDLGTGRLEHAGDAAASPSLDGSVLAASDERIATLDCSVASECEITVSDLGTGDPLVLLDGVGGELRVRATFSPDGRHLAYYLGEAGPGVTLWRINVVDVETGAWREAGPIFHDTFLVLDGGRYVVSPLPQGVVVSDTVTGELTPVALRVRVYDIELYG